jgi:hypothetical protein
MLEGRRQDPGIQMSDCHLAEGMTSDPVDSCPADLLTRTIKPKGTPVGEAKNQCFLHQYKPR